MLKCVSSTERILIKVGMLFFAARRMLPVKLCISQIWRSIGFVSRILGSLWSYFSHRKTKAPVRRAGLALDIKIWYNVVVRDKKKETWKGLEFEQFFTETTNALELRVKEWHLTDSLRSTKGTFEMGK